MPKSVVRRSTLALLVVLLGVAGSQLASHPVSLAASAASNDPGGPGDGNPFPPGPGGNVIALH